MGTPQPHLSKTAAEKPDQILRIYANLNQTQFNKLTWCCDGARYRAMIGVVLSLCLVCCNESAGFQNIKQVN
eukprot:2185490-Amphidinium_carterae.1